MVWTSIDLGQRMSNELKRVPTSRGDGKYITVKSDSLNVPGSIVEFFDCQ
jgi:hypothetical protein